MKTQLNGTLWLHIALLSVTVVLLTGSSYGDPRQWDVHGLSVRQGEHIQWDQVVAQDQTGDMLVVWTDARTGYFNVYTQLITPDGVVQWAQDGIALSANPAPQRKPAVVATGDGWIVSWVDCRNNGGVIGRPGGEIWAQRLDFQGNRLWPDNNFGGVCVDSISTVSVNELSSASDDLGGAYISWIEAGDVAPSFNLRSQHITAGGTVSWATSLDLAHDDLMMESLVMCPDGNNNVLLAWQDYRTDPQPPCIYAAKITLDGTMPWTTHGVLVNWIEMLSAYEPQICSDGAGGCYIAWATGEMFDLAIYAQHLDSTGVQTWVNGEITVCNLLCYGNHLQGLVPSFNNGTYDGCLVSWADDNFVDNAMFPEVHVQKLGMNGGEFWQHNGIPVAGRTVNSDHTSTDSRIVSDANGGLYCAWTNLSYTASSFASHIYATHVQANGNLSWGETGLIASVDSGYQDLPMLSTDNFHNLFLAWRDQDGNYCNVRCQSLDPVSGNLLFAPAGVTLASGLSGSVGGTASLALANGRTAVVWAESRHVPECAQLYYQLLSADGIAQFAPNGILLASDTNSVSAMLDAMSLCEDGNGGFYTLWQAVQPAANDCRLSKVNSAGERTTNLDGVHFPSEQGLVQTQSSLAADHTGGCYMVWVENTSASENRIYVLRINSELTPVWQHPLGIDDPAAFAGDVVVESAADGACIITWTSTNETESDIKSARVLANGALAWTRTVCGSPGNQNTFSAFPDSAGGSYYAWRDGRINGGMMSKIYAQHLSGAGVAGWETNGLLVSDSLHDEDSPRICRDNYGNLFIIWSVYNASTTSLLMQKIAPGGTRLWGANGRILCAAEGSPRNARVISDHGGGFIATWTDLRGVSPDVWATHIDSTGDPVADPYWIAESGGKVGSSVGAAPAQICLVSTGGFVISWVATTIIDYSTGFSVTDLRAQRFLDGFGDLGTGKGRPSLLTHYVLNQNYPNPFNPGTRIDFALPISGPVSLKIFNILGQQVSAVIDRKMEAGTYSLNFDGSRLPSGVYIYRLQSGGFDQCRKMILMK